MFLRGSRRLFGRYRDWWILVFAFFVLYVFLLFDGFMWIVRLQPPTVQVYGLIFCYCVLVGRVRLQVASGLEPPTVQGAN